MKKYLIWFSVLMYTVTVTPIVLLAFCSFDASKNRGWGFGYYGEFNRVGSALKEVSGIKPQVKYCNKDVSLEEFSYIVTMKDGKKYHLGFEESDPIRSLDRESMKQELMYRIQSSEQVSVEERH